MAANKLTEIRRFRRLLHEIAALAEEEEGNPLTVAKQYNAIVRQLEEKEIIPVEMFPMLGTEGKESLSFDEIRVQSRLLAGYLEVDEDEEAEEEEGTSTSKKRHDLGVIIGLAPFLGQEELRRLVRANLPKGKTVDAGLLVGLAPFLGGDELNRIVREHMPEWFRGQGEATSEEEPSEEATPAQPTPPARPQAPKSPGTTGTSLTTVESRFAEITDRLQAVAERLGHGDLTDKQRKELADELSHLAQEQARLAR